MLNICLASIGIYSKRSLGFYGNCTAIVISTHSGSFKVIDCRCHIGK